MYLMFFTDAAVDSMELESNLSWFKRNDEHISKDLTNLQANYQRTKLELSKYERDNV